MTCCAPDVNETHVAIATAADRPRQIIRAADKRSMVAPGPGADPVTSRQSEAREVRPRHAAAG